MPVVDVIKGIADQTNLLALNAAIEALSCLRHTHQAQCGQPKGFGPIDSEPGYVQVFFVPATCFSRSAHRTKRRLNGQKDLTPYREPAIRGLFVVRHSRC
ncbi:MULTISPECIES: methyl-accepting chemotaxis protein [Gammaproteobacteria]|uniref:methyl-accepting chemotaxis protein n=1 Tax=Gammaproteobacteria TaxID=1236 RepID=UPI001F5BC817|nr:MULTISPECIES: methyl-accepting chemotaxis protein [Gammaproteobacteria]